MKAINKEILKLAIPSILANITVPIVGMVDIAVAKIRILARFFADADFNCCS